MELKNFFAQDLAGNVIASPTVHLYAPGTTTPAAGLENAAGAPLTNPFTGSTTGFIQFAAPDGDYDLRVTGAGRDFTMRVRFLDASPGPVLALREELAEPGGSNQVGANAFQTQDGVNQERRSLRSFGASPAGTPAQNTVAVSAALAWMNTTSGKVLVDGLYQINGDMPVGSNGFHFYGRDRFNDGFFFAPQSGAITGGNHAYFLPSSSVNTSRMVFENLCLKSSYNSLTWTGSTVFAGLLCAPNSGVTHSNIEFRNCYFLDPSFTMVYMVPRLGGLVDHVLLVDNIADVSNLATSSRISNVLQTIIEGIDYAGHGSTYGLKQITNVQVRGGYGRGWRTYADLKRGTAQFLVDGVITENMSDCHHSTDGAFSGVISGVIGRQNSADIPTKNFVNITGEDLTLDKWEYRGTLGLGAIAAVLSEAYAYPSESSTSFHQPTRIKILNGTANGVNQNAVRLFDPIDCTVNGLHVSNITQAAVVIEHPPVTSNGGANAAVPFRNTVDNVTGGASVGTFGVNIAAIAVDTRIGNIDGFVGKTTGPTNYTPIYKDNENPNQQMLVDGGGFIVGWGLSASCTAAYSTTAPVWAAQSALFNGTSGAVLDQVGLNKRVRVTAGGVVSVRASTLLGTATATGILFQEYDSAGAFLSNNFQDVPSNSSTWTENILFYRVVNPACTNLKVWILPNTNFNNAVATGSSHWAEVVVTKKTA